MSSPPNENHLQPPGHWMTLELPEDDGDQDSIDDTSMENCIIRYRMLNGRTYHPDRGGQNHYWGPNDDRQNNTLDIGHHAWTLLLDGRLYLAPLPETIERAIDIGTGTGIWAMDFADERTETEVIGTDISPIQPTWVPPNVVFQMEDFAQEWTFDDNWVDYVHMRWLVGSVEDWTELYRNAFRVLKPGGLLESMEFDANVTSDDGTVTDRTAVYQWGPIFVEATRRMGTNISYNPIIEGVQRRAMEEAGFVNITETRYKVPFCEWPEDPVLREIGQFTRVAIANDIEGFVGMMATRLGWSVEEITVYAAHLRREMRTFTIHPYFRGCVLIGQKPEAPAAAPAEATAIATGTTAEAATTAATADNGVKIED